MEKNNGSRVVSAVSTGTIHSQSGRRDRFSRYPRNSSCTHIRSGQRSYDFIIPLEPTRSFPRGRTVPCLERVPTSRSRMARPGTGQSARLRMGLGQRSPEPSERYTARKLDDLEAIFKWIAKSDPAEQRGSTSRGSVRANDDRDDFLPDRSVYRRRDYHSSQSNSWFRAVRIALSTAATTSCPIRNPDG